MFVLTPEETGCKLPIKMWGGGADDTVMEQFHNLANHPLAHKWVCAMPDFHPGYGMPIGGVLTTRGGVLPNAVGVDIGCGMIAVRTQIEAGSLSHDALQALRLAIHARVPVGFQSHESPPRMLGEVMPDAPAGSAVITKHWDRAAQQLGTLGGGNHFIELQCEDAFFMGRGESVVKVGGEKRLWIMLHSGSRNIGKQVCDHYNNIAKGYMASFHVDVDSDLAFLPNTVPEYDAYLADMRWCMAFAEANRQAMLEAVYGAFEERGWSRSALGIDLTVDTHHNFAAMENHYGENLLIHRKGAVKAIGLVTIPGSMGTASYIGEGLTPRDSFNTCSHGAGRVMGRKVAQRTITKARAEQSMANVVYDAKGKRDEMPDAYKDIDDVMDAQSDLVARRYRLMPLAVVKG